MYRSDVVSEIAEHWEVRVTIGENAGLCIGDNYLSGSDLTEIDINTIEHCARSLLSFIGRDGECEDV